MSRSLLNEAFASCRVALCGTAVFSLAVNVLMLTTSLYMMQVYDRVLGSQSIETLIFLTLLAFGALAIMVLIDLARNRIAAGVGTWLELRLGPSTIERIISDTIGGREHRAEALRDLAALRSFLSGPALMMLFDAPWVPVYLAVVYMLHPVLGHIALSGSVLLLLLAIINDLATRRPMIQAGKATHAANQIAESGVRNAEVLDAMGMTSAFADRWLGAARLSAGEQSQAGSRAALLLAATKFIRQALQVLILGAGAWLVIRHEVTSGAMIAASIIMGRALAPIEQAMGAWRSVLHARQARSRLNEAFLRPPARPETMPLPRPTGILSVESVSYVAPESKRFILRGISFRIEPGEALAIIGHSAAGKSTLARLLVGVKAASSGIVRLDGADVHTWGREDLGRSIGYLPQDVELFAGTVRENISRLGDASPEEIVKAASMAGVHEMILRLEKGYDTQIGEGGALLSGGQRQRIALARALLGSPRLLVLDEPNASLDFEGEEALNGAITALKAEGAAIVVIGHRPAVLATVDKILLMRNGVVEAFGPRTEILQSINGPRPVRPAPAEAPPVRGVAT